MNYQVQIVVLVDLEVVECNMISTKEAKRLIWTYILLMLFLVSGWVMNIVKLATSDDPLSTGLSIVQIIGVFLPPLGVILGWVIW